AVGCGLRWRQGGRAGWLYAAVVLGTCGVSIKPMALAVAAPIGLFLLLRPGLRWQHLVISLALVAGITAGLVLLMGPADVYQQVVQYRIGARQAGTWEFRRNLKHVVVEPFQAQPGLWLLAIVGGLALISVDWRSGLALASWSLLAVGMLVYYHP